jgi:arylsulfatase A-like enzyme
MYEPVLIININLLKMKNRTGYLLLPAILFNGFNSLGQETKMVKPNIIFIITDDQSPIPIEEIESAQSRPFGFNGDNYVHTPNIDSLAKNGLTFSRAYVSSTVCSPSRYTILTGRYAGRCEGNDFMRLHPVGTQTRVENNTELEDDRQNLPRLLQQAGYRTGFVGKSHIVDHHLLRKSNWEDNGLMTYAPDADPKDNLVSEAMAHNHAFWVNRIKEFGFDYANAVYAANLRELYNDSVNVHNVEWINNAALDFIDDANDKPFFLYLSETIPHGPAPWIKRDGKYEYGLDANPRFTGEGYADYDFGFMPPRDSIRAEIENMQNKDPDHSWLFWFDHAVGSIVEKLKEKGLYENTLIVITSDHGNYNFGKSTLYEGGVKVPLLMHWPAGISNPGAVYDELVQNIDFVPTFLDLAGSNNISSMELDGVSLKGVLQGNEEPLHDYLFFELGYARAIATKEWKYITVRYDQETERKINEGASFNGWEGRRLNQPYYVRNSHLGYHATLFHPNYFSRDQLYNLVNDPEEKINVFDVNHEKLHELRGLLIQSLKTFENRPYGEFVE